LLKYFKSQGVLEENVIGQKGVADKKTWEYMEKNTYKRDT